MNGVQIMKIFSILSKIEQLVADSPKPRFNNAGSRRIIDEEELHMLLTAYWSTMFEPIAHGLSRERAIEHSDMVAKLFDWTAVLGF